MLQFTRPVQILRRLMCAIPKPGIAIADLVRNGVLKLPVPTAWVLLTIFAAVTLTSATARATDFSFIADGGGFNNPDNWRSPL